MQFRYTRHIRKRMRQRGLRASEIEETAASPEWTREGRRHRCLAQKRFHDKILEVVYREAGDDIVLITAYWLEEGG